MASQEQDHDSLESFRMAWEGMAKDNAMMAVLRDETKLASGWDQEAFYKTGRDQVEGLINLLADRKIPLSYGRALDFGCGVGRLAIPLADRFHQVIGVDLARAMISEAKSHDVPNLSYVLSASSCLPFKSGSFDLVVCNLVLMHVPPALIEVYIGEFFRLLSPQGIAVFTLPTHVNGSQEKLTNWIEVSTSTGPVLQHVTCVPKDQVVASIDQLGGTLEATILDGDPKKKQFGAYIFSRRGATKP